ncbi:MAG: electron transfer flavoprotein-ubiquinone oxidoreductase [candidate division Zixibacteria bacterium]|nr:electron transfer flavoprotein-ubiquinone oxidoreductase [candidate division Zixibacteria bacterium]
MAIERDVLDVDVLIVGAGPAGLACAYHLTKKAEEKGLEPPAVLVIEKGSFPGAHSFSGAVMNPSGIASLMPDFLEKKMPFEAMVLEDSLWFMTQASHYKLPFTPPGMGNEGNYIISLNKFTRWLAEQTEALGVDVYPETAACELIVEDGKTVGIQTVDMGLDKEGNQKSNFEPGTIIKASVTILAEGTHGSLTKQTKDKLAIFNESINQSYLTGVKEIWELPDGRLKEGEVIHTFGAPLPTYEYGGGFIYSMAGNMAAIGYAVGLNSPDPTNDAHRRFQEYKAHPSIRPILEGGTMLHYGAKTIPEGGYYSMPRLYDNSLLIIGDSAGFLNSQKLKGIHLAIQSGIMAAETIFEAIEKEDFSSATLKSMQNRFEASTAKEELFKVRNYHQGFEGGIFGGMIHSGFQLLSGGRGLFDKKDPGPDSKHMMKWSEFFKGGRTPKPQLKYDNKFLFDKLTDVYKSGAKHEEEQPSHLVISDFDICNNRCTVEYGNPCQYFCPAQVYEMVDNEDGTGKHLQLTPSNCVHCKTCDIADPYQVINWVVPEGGGGPNYENC